VNTIKPIIYREIKDLRETEFFSEKFYNFAESKIPKNIKDDILNIKFNELDTSNNKSLNSTLRNELRNRGWKKGENIGDFKNYLPDFMKEHIALEAQFRQDTNILYNILGLQHAFDNGKIIAGIIITYDAIEHIAIHGMNASIQILDIFLKEFEKQINFTIPLWAIGVKDHN